MTEAEQLGIDYLFKLRQSANVKKLLLQKHGASGWQNRIGILCGRPMNGYASFLIDIFPKYSPISRPE